MITRKRKERKREGKKNYTGKKGKKRERNEKGDQTGRKRNGERKKIMTRLNEKGMI